MFLILSYQKEAVDMDETKLFSVQEAAEKYFDKKISSAMIYNLVQKNQVECIRVGKRILIPKKSLDEFCRKNMTYTNQERE